MASSAILTAGILSASHAPAAALYYDISATTGIQGGTATWSTSAAAWQTSLSPGATTPQAWTNGSDAFFSTSTTANTVTLNGTVSANSVSVLSNATTTINGAVGTLLNIAGGGVINSGTATLTFNAPMSLSASQTWNSATGRIIANGTNQSLSPDSSVATNSITTLTLAGAIRADLAGVSNNASDTSKKLALTVNQTGGGVFLTGTSNYAGGTFVQSGLLQATGTTGAGTFNAVGTGTITVGDSTPGSTANAGFRAGSASGGTVFIPNAIVLGNTSGTVSLGSSYSSTGNLTNFSGGVTGSNSLNIISSTADGALSGGSVIFSGQALNMTGALNWLGGSSPSSTLAISGGIGSNVTSVNLKIGDATIDGLANTYTGPTAVSNSTLTVGGATTSSTINGSSSLTLTSAIATFNASPATTAVPLNQINDSATLSFTGGSEFSFKGSSTSGVTTDEVIGAITMGSTGANILTGTAAAGTFAHLLPASFTRTNGTGTLLIRLTGGGQTLANNTANIKLGTSPTDLFGGSLLPSAPGSVKSLPIVPYAIGDTAANGSGNNFVTYDTTSGYRTLASTEYTTLVAGSTTPTLAENVKAFNGTLLASTYTANSLFVGNVTLNGVGAITVSSGAILEAGTGTLTGFSSITLGNGQGVISTPSGNLTIAAPLNVSSSGGLVKQGAGILFFPTISPTYTGTTTINGGTIQYGVGGAAGDFGSNNAQVNITSAGTLSFIRRDDLTVTNSLAGSGIFFKQGAGTLTETGSSTGFTGSVTSRFGSIVFDAQNASNGTSTDYSLNATAALTLRSGTIQFKGKTGATNFTVQTLDSVTAGAYTGLNTIAVNKNGGGGTTVTLTSGLDSTGGGNGILVDLSGGGVLNSGTALSTALGNVLIKDSANRYDFAIATAGGAVTAANGTIALPAASTGTTNYKLDGSQTLTGNAAGNTLRINSTGSLQSLNVGASNLVLGTYGGLMFVGSNDYSITGSTGAIYGSSGVSIHHYGAGVLNISALLGNGAAYPYGVLFDGNGGLVDWTSSANNQVTSTGTSGNIGISGVTLRLDTGNITSLANSTSAITNNNPIVITNGGILELGTGDLTRLAGAQSPGKVTFNGNGGFSAYGADRFVNLGGASALQTWGTAGFIGDGATLILGSSTSNRVLDFRNPLALGTVERVIEVRNGVSSTDVDALLSGELSGTGGLIKTGTGTLRLTASNPNLTGSLSVQGGTLHAAASGALNSVSSISVNNAGSLLLGQLTGTNANALVKDMATVALSNGTLKVADTQAGFAETMGALTLSSGSTIDFGIGSNYLTTAGNTLTFSSLSLSGTLSVMGWSGTAYTLGTTSDGNTDALQDRLLFTTLDTNLYPLGTEIASISFYNDAGAFIGHGAAVSFSGGGFEIVAIPEPSTIYSLLMVAGLAGYRERRRIRGIIARI